MTRGPATEYVGFVTSSVVIRLPIGSAIFFEDSGRW
jgi:hypothetical protein